MLYGGSLGRYQEVTAPPKAVKERIDNELGEVGKELEEGMWKLGKTLWKKIHAQRQRGMADLRALRLMLPTSQSKYHQVPCKYHFS